MVFIVPEEIIFKGGLEVVRDLTVGQSVGGIIGHRRWEGFMGAIEVEMGGSRLMSSISQMARVALCHENRHVHRICKRWSLCKLKE